MASIFNQFAQVPNERRPWLSLQPFSNAAVTNINEYVKGNVIFRFDDGWMDDTITISDHGGRYPKWNLLQVIPSGSKVCVSNRIISLG